MPNEVLNQFGSLEIFSFQDTATYAPAVANIIEVGTPTNVEMDMTNIANGAAVQSNKFDWGNGSDIWAPAYTFFGCIEFFTTAPTTKTTLDLYIGETTNSIAANGNPGFLTGVDGAYTGTPADLTEALDQLDFIGSLVLTADIEFQIGRFGVWAPTMRRASLVIVNNSGQAMAATDVIETAIIAVPLIPEIQG